MSFLLDTNVVSERARPAPDQQVIRWLELHSINDAFLSVMTVGEIEQGILRLGDTKRAQELKAFLDRVEARFTGRILPITREVMREWSRLTARLSLAGRTMPAEDALIAATALTHNLVVVTRNVADFQAAGVNLLNPWESDV